VAAKGAKREAGHISVFEDIRDNEAILDVGPDTAAMLEKLVAKSKTILWNGPLGVFENGFRDGTDALAVAIAKSKAHSVIGGGDTVSAIEDLRLEKHFSFISTGGGAMLDFLAGEKLPGIEALG
jgi:phosphoglycerate kinase